MRLYASLMSAIALASLAANIGFGYYLHDFEQTNRRLNAQIVIDQQRHASQTQHIFLLHKELTVSESLVRQLQQQLHDTTLAVARVLVATTPHDVPWCSRHLRGDTTHTNTHHIGRQLHMLYQQLDKTTVDDVTYTDTPPNGVRVAVSVTATHDLRTQTDILTLTDTPATQGEARDPMRIVVATRCVYVIP